MKLSWFNTSVGTHKLYLAYEYVQYKVMQDIREKNWEIVDQTQTTRYASRFEVLLYVPAFTQKIFYYVHTVPSTKGLRNDVWIGADCMCDCVRKIMSFLSNPDKFDWVWGQIIVWAISGVSFILSQALSYKILILLPVNQNSGHSIAVSVHGDEQGIVSKVHGAGISLHRNWGDR